MSKTNETPIVSDEAIERQIYQEFATALETLARSYRRAILDLERLGPSRGSLLRAELWRATVGTIRASQIACSLLEPSNRSLAMKMPAWLHTVLTVATGVALVAAHTVIPASLMIPGVNIGVGTAVVVAVGLAASVGVDGSKVANTIGALLPKGGAK